MLPMPRWLLAAACAAALSGPAMAQTAQAPTASSLNATAGPFSVATQSVSSFSARGFGGGTIYYPSAAGRYGVVAISPGFTATQSSIAWLGRRLATHGLVVITMNTNSTLDQPASRATQLMAALNHVVNSSGSTVQSAWTPRAAPWPGIRWAAAAHSSPRATTRA